MFLAQRTDFDRWLDQNPLVLGGAALLIGAIFAAWGASNILSGSAVSKFGRRVEGGEASLYGLVRLALGIFVMLFGAYKLLKGLF